MVRAFVNREALKELLKVAIARGEELGFIYADDDYKEWLKGLKKEMPDKVIAESDVRYTITTEVSEEGIIEQNLTRGIHEPIEHLSRWIADTRDKELHDSLIMLGWRPPRKHTIVEGEWGVCCPSFTMTLIDGGIRLTMPGQGHFSGDEVGRLRDALRWAMEKLDE